MFGSVSPAVKNLLGINNEWLGVQTFTNPYPATSSSANDQKSSPAQIWIGQGWKTAATAGSHPVGIRQYVKPESGTTTARPVWQLDTSIDGVNWVNLANASSGDAVLLTTPITNWKGRFNIDFSNSSTIGTLQNLLFTNTSGSRVNIAAKFSSTIKAGIEFDNLGNHKFKAASSGATFEFQSGSGIDFTSTLVQIYSGGIYNYGGSFNQGKVTAGLADTTPPAYLTTFGSFAGKGTLVTESTRQLSENEFVIYADPSNANVCAGTPSNACSTYVTEGNCNAHALAGCSWSAGTSCSIWSGTDQSTCESQSPCAWGSASCSTANGTDQSTCENLNMPYGGSCSWDDTSCPSQGDQVSCEAISGCAWNDTCSGSLCNGTYNNGDCTGTFGSGCSGTALCSNLTDDGAGPCAAEAGCAWSSGQEIFLPDISHAEGNVSRFHYFKHIGPSGTTVVSPFSGSGDVLESAISLTTGQGVLVHAYKRDGDCSSFLTQSPCEAQSPCVWNPAVTCSDYNGNEGACNSAGASGCTWDNDTSTCNGAGSSAFCSGGTYAISKKWYKHATI